MSEIKTPFCPNKCTWCGRFIAKEDYQKGAYYEFTPDTEYTTESFEHCCIKCNKEPPCPT